MDLHACSQGTIRQEVIEAGVDQNFRPGLSRKSSTLSYVLHPDGRSFDMRAVFIAYIQANPGIIGYDIWCHPTTLIDIMQPCRRLNMFTHQVEAMREEFCRMHSTPPKPGSFCSMCALP